MNIENMLKELRRLSESETEPMAKVRTEVATMLSKIAKKLGYYMYIDPSDIVFVKVYGQPPEAEIILKNGLEIHIFKQESEYDIEIWTV